jgi:hypothetical protein
MLMANSTIGVCVLEEMNEKQRFYVSVQAKTVMYDQGDAAYELEIDATPEQIKRLHELFESASEADFTNYLRAHNPVLIIEDLVNHDWYDLHLQEIYRMLYELGTDETRAHIEKMGFPFGLGAG